MTAGSAGDALGGSRRQRQDGCEHDLRVELARIGCAVGAIRPSDDPPVGLGSALCRFFAAAAEDTVSA
jgi:hypothetical protein